jgi:hypothetical protein
MSLVKARMVIGGDIDDDQMDTLLEALADSQLWYCHCDEDDDHGENPADNKDYDEESRLGFWGELLDFIINHNRHLILTVEDGYEEVEGRPLDDTDAFEKVQQACEDIGLYYRITSAGGQCRETDSMIDRSVTTHAPSGVYRGFVDLAARHGVIPITDKLLADPVALAATAKHAWMAASWPIPAFRALALA